MKKMMKQVVTFLGTVAFFGILFKLGLDLGRSIAGNEPSGTNSLISLIYFALTFILQIAIHEAGHLVAGLLSGYRFLSYRLFNLLWQKTDGKLRFSLYSLTGTLGQCLMIPPKPVDGKIPYLLYNLGGGLANLLIIPISVLMTKTGFLDPEFTNSLGFWGLVFALTNLIPLTDTIGNDGANIKAIAKHPQGSLFFANPLTVHALLTQGYSYSQMPDELFVIPDQKELSNHILMGSLAPYVSRLIEEGKYRETIDFLTNLHIDQIKTLPLYQTFYKALINYCQMLVEEPVTPLLTDKDWKLLKALAPSQPTLLVFNYAYYHLVEPNSELAEKNLTLFKKLEKNYHLPVEYAIEKEKLAEFQEIIDKRK